MINRLIISAVVNVDSSCLNYRFVLCFWYQACTPCVFQRPKLISDNECFTFTHGLTFAVKDSLLTTSCLWSFTSFTQVFSHVFYGRFLLRYNISYNTWRLHQLLSWPSYMEAERPHSSVCWLKDIQDRTVDFQTQQGRGLPLHCLTGFPVTLQWRLGKISFHLDAWKYHQHTRSPFLCVCLSKQGYMFCKQSVFEQIKNKMLIQTEKNSLLCEDFVLNLQTTSGSKCLMQTV